MERFYNLENVKKSDDKIAVKTGIYASDLSSAVVWVVKKGQSVKCHMHPNADDLWIVMEGEGIFYEELGKDRVIKKGDIIVNTPNTCHGVDNVKDEDLVFLGVLAPSPAEYVALV